MVWVLAGTALPREVTFELDLKGLARFPQAAEGKKGQSRQGEQQEDKQGGRKACGTLRDGRDTAWRSMKASTGQGQDTGRDNVAVRP